MASPKPNRIISWLLIVALCMSHLAITSMAMAASDDVVYVKVGRAYLRQGPGVNYTQRALVSEGTRLEVTSRRGGWLDVKTTMGDQGWILSKATTSTPPPEVVVQELKARITDLEDQNTALQERIRVLADARQDIELEASQGKAEVSILQAKINALESNQTFLWACLGVVVLIIGWGLGFFTGMSRRQLEARHQNEMVKATRDRMGS